MRSQKYFPRCTFAATYRFSTFEGFFGFALEPVVLGCILQLGVLFTAYIVYSKYKMSYENILFADAYAVNGTPQGSVSCNELSTIYCRS